MKGHKFLLILLVIYGSLNLFAQENPDNKLFASPIDFNILLSGNFGEIRKTHFHAGLDIKTEQQIRKNIYSVADGYVEKIRISPWGYGKFLSIKHTNGYISTYGHLDAFSDKINALVEEYQYKTESFSVEMELEPGQLPVSKGELIALSGNTGGSGGPHLHFEIRDKTGNKALNPMLFGFNITDNVKPRVYNIMIYPLTKESHINEKRNKIKIPVYMNNGTYSIKPAMPLTVHGKIGIAVETLDYMNYTNNYYGIYSLELSVDKQRKYFHEMNNINIDDWSFSKSFSDYEEMTERGKTFFKTFRDPGNYSDIIKYSEDIILTDDKLHNFNIIIKDTYGNKSVVDFNLQSTSKTITAEADTTRNLFMKRFYHNIKNEYRDNDFYIFVPDSTLYDTIDFRFAKGTRLPGCYSDIYYIHDEKTPLHRQCTIGISNKEIPVDLRNKAVVVRIDKNGKQTSIGGELVDSFIVANIKYFGQYTLKIDTVAPVIYNLSMKYGANLSGLSSAYFRIGDNLSGIKTYNGYIDNNWVLMEYDAKTSRLSMKFDKKRIETGKKHTFELKVTDNKGNSNSFNTVFYY